MMAEAEFVQIDHDRLASMVETYRSLLPHRPRVNGAATTDPIDEPAALLVIALDAINFGSGYHDVVRKGEGLSGARSMAGRLRSFVETTGPLDSARLRSLSPSDCTAIFGQETDSGPVDELMQHFATALVQLGSWLDDEHEGSAALAIERAGRSGVRFAESLLDMPYYRDVEVVETGAGRLEVAFYKRAQITAADLERECGPGLFDDLDQLTAFADNLVPHVLRIDGILVVDPALTATIDAGISLPAGSRGEVELRAGGVVAVELLAEATGHRPMDLDLMLWERGGAPEFKAVRRHRTRSVFY